MILLYILLGVFILMECVAFWQREDKNIDEDNPYLCPEKKNVLPDNMQSYIKPAIKKLELDRNLYVKYVKRIIDIILSFCGFVILFPICMILALAVIVDDPGPIFFNQKRVGKDKKFFKLHKFRSMKMSAPHNIPTHMLINSDQYITRVGRFLRKSSLDELPQIWDIFRGKMSIIGPRPALWNQADLVTMREQYGANDVLPGLTGWAQINGRDELDIDVKAELDGEYCKRVSFLFDCGCFFSTIFSVIYGKGVVEGGFSRIERSVWDDTHSEDE